MKDTFLNDLTFILSIFTFFWQSAIGIREAVSKSPTSNTFVQAAMLHNGFKIFLQLHLTFKIEIIENML